MTTKESEPKNILEYFLFQKLEMLTQVAVSLQDENMEGITFCLQFTEESRHLDKMQVLKAKTQEKQSNSISFHLTWY